MNTLDGINIVSLCVNLPGPMAASRLTSMGAMVTKIEPETGDPLFHAAPDFYSELTKNQKIIKLNLKQNEDKEKLFSLLEKTDVILTSNRLEALARLGLLWSDLHSKFPSLCMVSIVGHAVEGHPGHDLTYQAEAGLISPPQMPQSCVADMAGAEIAVTKIFEVLFLRERTKKSAHAIVSLGEAAKTMAMPKFFSLTGKNKILGGGHPAYNLYETQHGWIALAALEEHFQKKMKEQCQLETLTIPALKKLFQTKTAIEWEQWAQNNDIPLAIVKES